MNSIDFENRKIALIGNGYLCRHFYIQFSPVLDIEYYFVNAADATSSAAEDFLKIRK